MRPYLLSLLVFAALWTPVGLVFLAADPLSIPAPPDFANLKRDGSVTVFGPGEFFPPPGVIRLGDGVVIRGAGMDKSRLVSTDYKVSATGCFIEANNCLVEDFCFECRTGVGEQNQVFGWQHNYSNGPASKVGTLAKLNRTWVLGRTFGLYCWSDRGSTPLPNRVVATNCRFTAGQFAVLAGGGSGPDAQWFDLYNCEIEADFDRLGAGGDQGLNCCCVAAQGGRVRVFGGSMRVKAGPKAERAVGAWTTKFPATPPAPAPDWPYPFPNLELVDVDCKVDANGCTGPVFDVIGDVGPEILVVRGSGSGPNGEWLTRGKVRVVK